MSRCHSLFHRSCVLALLAISIAVPRGGLCAAETPWSLDEIKQRIIDWQSRIVTLRVTWRLEGDPQSKSARENNNVGVSRVEHSDFIWTDSGAVRYHHWLTLDGKVVTRTAYLFGSSANWMAHYPRGESVEPKAMLVQLDNDKSSQRLYGLVLDPIWGLWFPRAPRWLGARFEQGTIKLVGTETRNDCMCPVVLDVCPIYGHETHMVLDPDHGFLPVRVEMPGKGATFVHSVEEFSEAAPGFFFPKRGSSETYMGKELYDSPQWTIETVELNEPIPDSLWQAPIADGTEVFDATTGKSFVHGGKRLNPDVVATVTDLAKAMPEGRAVEATAPAERWNWWPIGLVGAAVALLGAAVVLRRVGK